MTHLRRHTVPSGPLVRRSRDTSAPPFHVKQTGVDRGTVQAAHAPIVSASDWLSPANRPRAVECPPSGPARALPPDLASGRCPPMAGATPWSPTFGTSDSAWLALGIPSGAPGPFSYDGSHGADAAPPQRSKHTAHPSTAGPHPARLGDTSTSPSRHGPSAIRYPLMRPGNDTCRRIGARQCDGYLLPCIAFLSVWPRVQT